MLEVEEPGDCLNDISQVGLRIRLGTNKAEEAFVVAHDAIPSLFWRSAFVQVVLKSEIVDATGQPVAVGVQYFKALGQVVKDRPANHLAGLRLRMKKTTDTAAVSCRDGISQVAPTFARRRQQFDLIADSPVRLQAVYLFLAYSRARNTR